MNFLGKLLHCFTFLMEKVSLISLLNLSCFSLHVLFLILLLCPTAQGLAPCRNWGLLLGGTKAIPASSMSPPRSSAPAPCHHGGLQLNPIPVINLCLGLGSQNCFPSFFCYRHHMMQISRKWRSLLQCPLPFVEPAPKAHPSTPERACR